MDFYKNNTDKLINAANQHRPEQMDYEHTIFHSQAEDIVAQITAATDEQMAELKAAIEKSGKDTVFAKCVAIISIVIALISAIFAGVSLALQLGLLK